jgi:hypothetical protein
MAKIAKMQGQLIHVLPNGRLVTLHEIANGLF